MLDGIIFDLDGTLWDAVPQLTLCWNQAMELHQVNRPPLTVEELRDCMGMLLDDIGRRLFPSLAPEKRQAVMKDCTELEVDYLSRHGGSLFPGEEAVLARLAGRCPLYIVSNCQDGYIQSFYAGTGLGKYFRDFACSGPAGTLKKDNIARMVSRHGLKAPVYVGDTQLDCDSARAAGVPFLHAAYGFGKVDGVPAVQSFEQLPEALGL